MECKCCSGICIKRGKYKGVQKFFCKNCSKYQREHYTKPRIDAKKMNLIKRLNNEGLGISSISRLLHISKSSTRWQDFMLPASSRVSLGLCAASYWEIKYKPLAVQLKVLSFLHTIFLSKNYFTD